MTTNSRRTKEESSAAPNPGAGHRANWSEAKRNEPAPSVSTLRDVRARILADHARLRTLVADVDRLAGAVAAEDLRLIDQLRERAAVLYKMLGSHIDHEESVLAPIIRRIDAWGNVRWDQLQSDHATQRTALEDALRDLENGGADVGHMVQSMCWEILHDMKREEHDLLHPDLWRDDPIVVHFGG